MKGIKETQKLNIGDAQGIPSSYCKASQASKLGNALVGIPPFFFNNHRLASVEPKSLLLHMICAILGVISFCFACCLNKILRSENT